MSHPRALYRYDTPPFAITAEDGKKTWYVVDAVAGSWKQARDRFLNMAQIGAKDKKLGEGFDAYAVLDHLQDGQKVTWASDGDGGEVEGEWSEFIGNVTLFPRWHIDGLGARSVEGSAYI